LINRERKKWSGINKDIKMEEWEDYFKKILGGVEWRVVWGEKGERRTEEEEGIRREEIEKIVRGLKVGKAMGIDGVPNEVWKYGGEETVDWIWDICDRVWKGEGWPEEWREGVVVPIKKKGKGVKIEEYRGITIMSSLYKVYTAVLAGRLREEVEGKSLIPPNQAGFRKGMGTLDNIYVLNYLINRQIRGKGGKLVAIFVDLRAAFDSVDRGELIRAMRGRGVREGLVERVEEMLKETRSRVKIGGQMGRGFWTARGLRQGCPLSPLLFNLLIADLEEELGRVKWGGVKLGEERIYSLAYADDMVLLAEEEGGMRSLIERLENYLKGKGLELNVEKTKIVRFKRGGGRLNKVNWSWGGSRIEEVREYKYLGYKMQRNGGQESHIKERVAKAAAIMGQVWGIGRRRFGKDWKRRMWMFDRLVWTVAGYGVEIWGWKERERVERLQERFIRWVMGVEGRTPGYMVREEIQRGKMRGRAGRRAWEFEERMAEGRGSTLAQRCWQEMRDRILRGREISEWEKEREQFFRERGVEYREWEGKRMREEARFQELEEKDKEMQKEERWDRIRKARYNKWYGMVKGEGIPAYLEKGWGESRWRRVVRFRLGNEMKEGRYWEEEDKRMCRLCGGEIESWEHVWEECRMWKERGNKSWQEVYGRILGEDGEGEGWMKEVEVDRGKGDGKEGEMNKGNMNINKNVNGNGSPWIGRVAMARERR